MYLSGLRLENNSSMKTCVTDSVKDPLVSVCVLSWNHEQYISKCLDSILQQDYSNIEIIFLDNGSSDATYWLALELLSRSQVPYKCSQNKAAQTIPVNANQLLNWANGRYVVIISGDDWMAASNVSKRMAKMIREPEVALVYAETLTYFETENRYEQETIGDRCDGNVFECLLKGNFIPAPGILLDKEKVTAVGGYNEEVGIEDWDLWLRLSQCYKIGYVSEPLVYYRRHSSNTSQLDNISYIKEKLKTVEGYKGMKGYRVGKENVLRQLISASINSNPRWEAFTLLCRHTKFNLFYLKQWMKFIFRQTTIRQSTSSTAQ